MTVILEALSAAAKTTSSWAMLFSLDQEIQVADPVKPNRFRVALSFPGEHRPRVERIADALAGRLGRDRILYDRWYAPEFARPNLDDYLTKLYHDESDLIVVFLSKEYNAKEWCGLEWRARRDVLK